MFIKFSTMLRAAAGPRQMWLVLMRYGSASDAVARGARTLSICEAVAVLVRSHAVHLGSGMLVRRHLRL